jgi:hypothetical protein
MKKMLEIKVKIIFSLKNIIKIVDDYVNNLNATFKDKFIATHKVTDIQILLHKAKNDYYTSLDEVLIDFIFLFKYINANINNYIHIEMIKHEKKYKLYLNNLYSIICQKIVSLRKIYYNNYKNDLKHILQTNMLPKKSKKNKSYFI